MEDGSIKFKFVNGQITGAFINAGLDSIYERIFQNAKRSTQRNPNNVVHGIKVLVFGCFWLEASCNECLKYFLDNWVTQKAFSESLWDTLKRANIIDKFRIISAFATKNQLQQYESLLPSLKRVFDLRNRLAHFKDKDFPIADNVDVNEVISLLLSAPESELIQELKGLKIKKHAQAISRSKSWLGSVYRRYSKAKSYSADKSPKKI